MPCRVTTVSICRSRDPTGMTRRPPSASWSRSGIGIAGAAAVTMIPSHGAPAASPRLPSASRTVDRAGEVRAPSSRSRAGATRSAWRSSDVTSAPEPGEDRRLVAGAGADLEDPVARLRPRGSSVISGDHERLADRLAGIDREGLVGVGVAAASPSGTNASRGIAPIAARTRSSAMPRARSWRCDHRGPGVVGIRSRDRSCARGYAASHRASGQAPDQGAVDADGAALGRRGRWRGRGRRGRRDDGRCRRGRGPRRTAAADAPAEADADGRWTRRGTGGSRCASGEALGAGDLVRKPPWPPSRPYSRISDEDRDRPMTKIRDGVSVTRVRHLGRGRRACGTQVAPARPPRPPRRRSDGRESRSLRRRLPLALAGSSSSSAVGSGGSARSSSSSGSAPARRLGRRSGSGSGSGAAAGSGRFGLSGSSAASSAERRSLGFAAPSGVGRRGSSGVPSGRSVIRSVSLLAARLDRRARRGRQCTEGTERRRPSRIAHRRDEQPGQPGDHRHQAEDRDDRRRARRSRPRTEPSAHRDRHRAEDQREPEARRRDPSARAASAPGRASGSG